MSAISCITVSEADTRRRQTTVSFLRASSGAFDCWGSQRGYVCVKLYHSTPVETQNSSCSGSDILTHRVPP